MPADGAPSTGSEQSSFAATLATLKPQLSWKAKVLQPDDAEFAAETSSFSAAFKQTPSAVIVCGNVHDVTLAIKFARARKQPFTVACGRHGGNCMRDNILCISLAGMRDVTVDPRQRLAYVSGGALNYDVDHACAQYHLQAVTGNIPDTGASGLIGGGGHGYISRKHGLSCDNVVAAEVVTADGEVLYVGEHSTEQKHKDLYWAIRGCAANFGIVTKYVCKVFPVGHQPQSSSDKHAAGTVLAGPLVFPGPLTAQVFSTITPVFENGASWPRDGCAVLVLTKAGPGGHLACVVVPNYTGSDVNQGLQHVDQLRATFKQADIHPVFDGVAPMSFLQLQNINNDKVVKPCYGCTRSAFVAELTPDIVQVLIEQAEKATTDSTLLAIQFDGAIGDVAIDHNAFPHRKAKWWIEILGQSRHASEYAEVESWAQQTKLRLAKYALGSYNNGVERGSVNDQGLFAANLQRLRRIKDEFDHDNTFAYNNNILPAHLVDSGKLELDEQKIGMVTSAADETSKQAAILAQQINMNDLDNQ